MAAGQSSEGLAWGEDLRLSQPLVALLLPEGSPAVPLAQDLRQVRLLGAAHTDFHMSHGYQALRGGPCYQ